MDPEGIVLAFVAAWTALDYDAIYALLSDDIVYHNIPFKPIRGRDAARAKLDAWPIDSCAWIVTHIASNGNVVLTERVDSFIRGTDRIVVPVMGAFEVADGKITHWRDYFDKDALTPRAAQA